MKKLLLLAATGLIGWACVGLPHEEGLFRELLAQAERQRALDVRCETVRRSNEGKQVVTTELVAGRLTLAQAVDHFARLGELFIDGLDDLLGPSLVVTDRKQLCASVLQWAEAVLRSESAEHRAKVLARLQREYAALEAASQ